MIFADSTVIIRRKSARIFVDDLSFIQVNVMKGA